MISWNSPASSWNTDQSAYPLVWYTYAESQTSVGMLLKPKSQLFKDRVLCVWQQECAAARERTAEQERRLKAVRLKLD